MAGLKELAGTSDAGLQQGFEKVLTSTRQAHLEGLQQSASASHGACRITASPAPLRPAAARPLAGGASRKARKASAEQLASYLFGDKVPHSLFCGECSSPATFAVRGGKAGSDLKYFCGVHREVTGCFKIEKTRADWARDWEVYKLKAELARALDEESRLRGNRDCNGRQESGYWGDATPKSRLIAKLLIMGGIESNPGHSSREASPEGERPPASGGDTPALDGGVAVAPHPHDAAAVTSDANDALADMIAHAEAQMNLPASDVGTRRPQEWVSSEAEPSKRRRKRLVKILELASGASVELAAGTQPAACAGAEEAGELEEDLDGSSERAAGSRRIRRRAMKKRVVAGFFAERDQQREAWAAREEEMFGPPSSLEQHNSATDFPELEALATDDAEAGEQEPLGRHSPAPTAPDVIRSQDSEARPLTSVAPKTGRLTSKKRCKRAKPNPIIVDEAARAAGRAAVEAHHQTLRALRAPRTQHEGQAVHQTELGDFGGPPHANPVGLVTDAPIPNVGALVDRLRAKGDAEEAAARENRLKSYGRVRPPGASRGTGDAMAYSMDQDSSPSSPLPSVDLPSREEDPPQSMERAPSGAPSSPTVEDEWAPPSPRADQPPIDAEPGLPPFSQPYEPPSPSAGDQLQEPLVIIRPPLKNAQPEVVPSEPPAAAPSPSPTHQEQAPVDQALAPDLPNQPPAADTSQPTATGPSVEPSTAPPPLEPPTRLPREPPQPASVRDSGPSWCKKLEEALQQRRANGRAMVVAEDVHEGGAKRYGSLKDVAALVVHRKSLGPFAHLYEVIQDDACWRVYFDLDFLLPIEDPSDFERRLEAFHLVKNRFLTSVLNVPVGALRFQACEAHGPARPPKQEFKYSVHEVLEGFYLRGLEARRAFGKAFGCFLESPPDDLKASIELLRKDNGSAYMWDGSVYGRHRCFRILRSSKFGDRLRSLVPSKGSSEAIADHLVCLYSEAELAGSTEISADLLGSGRGLPAEGAHP